LGDYTKCEVIRLIEDKAPEVLKDNSPGLKPGVQKLNKLSWHSEATIENAKLYATKFRVHNIRLDKKAND
jgi:hypothetical protein